MKKIFGREKNIVIGAIHFPPLLGRKDFPGFDIALTNALADLASFEKGGVDAVIVENNYDLPHTEKIDESAVASLTYLAEQIFKRATVPVGISVLWNDYRAALAIAKTVGLRFVRVPVFVDDVRTDYGEIFGKPDDVTAFRKAIGAEHIALFTDIHVKHATIISAHSIEESANQAIAAGSDALIVTGKWTGMAPDLKELASVRKTVGEFPIFCGSGVDAHNINDLYALANGSIVSTSLKKSTAEHAVNVRPYEARVDEEKVRDLVSKVS